MKRVVLFFLVSMLNIAVFTSCQKSGCTYKDAINYDSKAEVDDGSCIFPEPDDEPEPDTDVRDLLTGQYTCIDSAFRDGYEPYWEVLGPYTVNITKGNTIKDTLYINGFASFTENRMIILSDRLFNVPNVENTNIFSGNGSFEGNKIEYKLRVNQGMPSGGSYNLYGRGAKN